MPRVPEYNKQSVAPQGYQGMLDGNTQPAAFGVTLGAAGVSVGSDMMDVATRMKAEDDKNAVSAAVTAFRTKLNDYNRSAEALLSKSGGDANEEAFKANKLYIEELAKEAAQGLQPGAQQGMYDTAVGDYIEREDYAGSMHVAEQRKVYALQLTDSEVAASVNDMVANPNDQAPYIRQIGAAADKAAKLKGWDDVTKRNYIQEQVNSGIGLTAEGMMAREDFEGAKAYLGANKDLMIEKTYNDLLGRATEGGEVAQSLSLAESIAAGGGSITDQRRQVLAMDLPADLKSSVISNLNTIYGWNQQELTLNRNDILSQANIDLQNDPLLGGKKWLIDHPNEAALLTPGQRKNIISTSYRGEPDGVFYNQLVGMTEMPDRAQKAEAAKLLDDGLARLTPAQEKDIRARIKKTVKPPNETSGFMDDFNAELNVYLGPKPKPSAAKALEEYNNRRWALSGAYQLATEQWLKENPGTYSYPPVDERKRILADVMYTQTKENNINLFGEGPVSLNPFDDKITIKDIPPAELTELVEDMKAEGVPITTKDMLEYYTRYKEANGE